MNDFDFLSIVDGHSGETKRYSITNYSSNKNMSSLESKLHSQIYGNAQTGGYGGNAVKFYLSSNFEHYFANGKYTQNGGKGEGLALHREFITYIQKKLKVKGGVPLQQLGSYYKKLAKEKSPNETNTNKITDSAKKLFDDDKGALDRYNKFTADRKKSKAK